MKTKMTLFILFLTTIAFAQNGINYKAVIKDADGSILANQDIRVRFIIEEQDGSSAYIEYHSVTTNNSGLIILNIGEGTPGQFQDFSTLAWGDIAYNLEVAIRVGDAAAYIVFDETPFKAVPYALSSADNYWEKTGNTLSNKIVNKLELNANNAYSPLALTSETNYNYMTYNNGNGYRGYSGVFSGTNDMDFGTGIGNSSGNVNLVTEASPKLTVTANGNVGIGTEIPTQTLDVNGKLKIANDSENPTPGTIRFNETTNAFEGYIEEEGWITLGEKKREKMVVVPASAFIVNRNIVNNIFYTTNSVSFGRGTSSISDDIYVIAPIVLPVGSKLISISYVYEDNSTENDLDIVFSKYCGDVSVDSENQSVLNVHAGTGVVNSNLSKYTYNLNETMSPDCQYIITVSARESWITGRLYFHKVYITYEEN